MDLDSSIRSSSAGVLVSIVPNYRDRQVPLGFVQDGLLLRDEERMNRQGESRRRWSTAS